MSQLYTMEHWATGMSGVIRSSVVGTRDWCERIVDGVIADMAADGAVRVGDGGMVLRHPGTGVVIGGVRIVNA